MSARGVLLHSSIKNDCSVELTRTRRFHEESENLIQEDYGVYSIVPVCRNKVLLSTLSATESAIRVYNWETRKHFISMKNPHGRVSWCVKRINKPHQHLVIGEDRNLIFVWDFKQKKGTKYKFHDRFVEDIVQLDGSNIASGDDGGNILLWDVVKPLDRPKKVKISSEWIMSLEYSNTRSLLFAGCRDGRLKSFDPRQRKNASVVSKDSHCLTRIRLCEPMIITGNKYGKITTFDLRKTKQRIQSEEVHKSWVWRIEHLSGSHNPLDFASCGSDNFLKLWRIKPNGIKILGSKTGKGNITNTENRRTLRNDKMVGLAYSVDLSFPNEELNSHLEDVKERLSFLTSTSLNTKIIIHFYSVHAPKIFLLYVTKKIRNKL